MFHSWVRQCLSYLHGIPNALNIDFSIILDLWTNLLNNYQAEKNLKDNKEYYDFEDALCTNLKDVPLDDWPTWVLQSLFPVLESWLVGFVLGPTQRDLSNWVSPTNQIVIAHLQKPIRWSPGKMPLPWYQGSLSSCPSRRWWKRRIRSSMGWGCSSSRSSSSSSRFSSALHQRA